MRATPRTAGCRSGCPRSGAAVGENPYRLPIAALTGCHANDARTGSMSCARHQATTSAVPSITGRSSSHASDGARGRAAPPGCVDDAHPLVRDLAGCLPRFRGIELLLMAEAAGEEAAARHRRDERAVDVEEDDPSGAHARSAVRPEMERVTGIEPALPAWEAGVLPLNYTRASRSAGRRQPYRILRWKPAGRDPGGCVAEVIRASRPSPCRRCEPPVVTDRCRPRVYRPGGFSGRDDRGGTGWSGIPSSTTWSVQRSWWTPLRRWCG